MAEIMVYLGFIFYGVVIVVFVSLLFFSVKILNTLKEIKKAIEERKNL